MTGCGCGTHTCISPSCDCVKTGKCTCGPSCKCQYSSR